MDHPSVPELVEALIAHPSFRGVVIWDPAYEPGQVHGPDQESKFRWRSNHCDQRSVCSGVAASMIVDPPADTQLSGPVPK